MFVGQTSQAYITLTLTLVILSYEQVIMFVGQSSHANITLTFVGDTVV